MLADDGFSKDWYGKVWLNPPYSGEQRQQSNQALWSAKLIQKYLDGQVSEALLLVNAVPGLWFSPL